MNGHEPRLLIYSQDGLGLGHMRRTSLLAQEFLRQVPGASALTLSDSPLGQFFATATGHDFLKLPSIRKTGPGRWEPVSLSAGFEDVLELRSRLIASAVESYDPQILLVDHMPHGAMGELIPALRSLRGRRMRVVLGLRDILDAPETVRRRWTAEGAYEALEEFYDEVLVYGSEDVLDVAREYSWPASSADRLTYCGYVCDQPPGRGRRLAQRWQATHQPRVLVVAGGGADAYPMFTAVLDAAAEVHRTTGAEFTLVTGPFMPEDHVRALRHQARGVLGADVRRKIRKHTKVSKADLVIAMAGYNTTIELLNSGTPALLIPRSGPSAEQRTRARLFAERRWVRQLDPDHLEPSTVARAITTALDEPLRPETQPALTGREVAVGRFTLHLGLEAALESAAPVAT